MMALMTTIAVGPKLPLQKTQSLFHQVSRTFESVAVCNVWESQRLWFPYVRDSRNCPWSVHAVGPGLEASISDNSKNDLRLDDIKIVIQSRDNDKINLRVDLTGEETQKAFDAILTNLARTAPPVPGFRRKKGGKTSNVPKSFLLQMLGRDRVTKFFIQEVVSITIGDYVKKEKLKVKSQFKTIQTAEELEAAFAPVCSGILSRRWNPPSFPVQVRFNPCLRCSMELSDCEEMLKVLGACLSHIGWRLKLSTRRRLETDILALCTRLRPAVLVDYGGIMPKLQENLSSLLLLAKKESNTLQHLRVMILDDMVYIVNVEELAEYVFLSLSSGQRLILLDLEQCPLKILPPTEDNDIASELFSIQKLFSMVFPVGVDKESCIEEKHSAIQIADPIDLSSFLHDARITLPSLNGWLLGYPITYLFSKEYAKKAAQHLSTKSLRIFKIIISRQQASGSQLYETELMSFTVPCDMSQRLDKEPWIAAFLSRISERLKRFKQIWASMRLEMEVSSDQLVVL